MATKKKAVVPAKAGKAVTLFSEQSKPLAPVADWRTVAAEHLQDSAKSLAAMPTGGGNWLSFKDTGRFALGQEDVGSELDIVIVAHATEFSYFDSPYVEGQKSAAACYSLDNEKPHPESPRKQHENCAHCPQMQMGSDERQRGRACKVKGRIAFIMADQVTDIDSIMGAALYYATPSTLNSMPLRTYLVANDRAESPIFGKRTKLTISAGGKAKYALTFQRTGVIENDDALRALAARNIEARAEMKKARPVFENEGGGSPARGKTARKRKF